MQVVSVAPPITRGDVSDRDKVCKSMCVCVSSCFMNQPLVTQLMATDLMLIFHILTGSPQACIPTGTQFQAFVDFILMFIFNT